MVRIANNIIHIEYFTDCSSIVTVVLKYLDFYTKLEPILCMQSESMLFYITGNTETATCFTFINTLIKVQSHYTRVPSRDTYTTYACVKFFGHLAVDLHTNNY